MVSLIVIKLKLNKRPIIKTNNRFDKNKIPKNFEVVEIFFILSIIIPQIAIFYRDRKVPDSPVPHPVMMTI